jgi:hypothetical protein
LSAVGRKLRFVSERWSELASISTKLGRAMRRIAAFLLCLCLVSCEGNNKYGDYPPYPVSGQVLMNGKPAARVNLAFYLDGYKGEKSIVPQGATDDEGRFVLSTYDPNDGAPAGDYHVVAKWKPSGGGSRSSEDKLNGKYSNFQTTTLTAHVEKGKNELKPFELEVDETTSQPRPGKAKVFRGSGNPPATPAPAPKK